MKMKKKLILATGVLVFLLPFSVVKAATCDYSEQVELNNIAGTVKANYEIKDIVTDYDGNPVSGIDPKDVTADSENLTVIKAIYLNILNVTDDIYFRIKSDQDLDKTYYFNDLENGSLILNSGMLEKIINYQIIIYSNRANCSGTELRKIDIVTPKENPYSKMSMCQDLKSLDYCKEYITAPFYQSDSEIQNTIQNKFTEQKQKEQIKKDEEEKKIGFWEKIKDFIVTNKIYFFLAIGIIAIIGVVAIVIVIKKRRSRVL